MADTLNEMILGFVVILGILAVYILILAIRMRREKLKTTRLTKNQPKP